MLLNDIGKSPDTTFRKINHHLEANYGFKISEDVSDKDLVSIMEQIEEEITELKVKGDDAKSSPEISKRLLVLEGIQNLREFAMMQQFQSPDFDHVLNGLCDYVTDCFRIGGTGQADYEDAIRDAMKHYRSSRYRFPDDLVEQRVRQMSLAKINGPAAGELGVKIEEPAFPTMMESEDEEMKESDLEEDAWGSVGKRASARGGYAPGQLDQTQNDVLGKLGFAPDPMPPEEEPVKLVRDKHGRMVPDPFAAQAAARRKGIVMKEDDVDEATRVMGRTGHGEPLKRMPKGLPGAEEHRNATAAMAKQHRASGGKMRNDWAKNVGKDGGQVMKYDSKDVEQMNEKTNLVKRLRTLLETEVSQAEVMMAAKGFAQELQEMIEKIGRLQNEDLPPVTDQMRETYGMESASAFQTQIAGALQSVMDSLYTAKSQVDDAVSNMATTGQVGASVDMEMDPGMDPMADPMAMDAEADLDNLDAEMDAEVDDFGAAGSEEPLGRSMKAESIKLQKKVLEMKRLVEKARKLRETRRG